MKRNLLLFLMLLTGVLMSSTSNAQFSISAEFRPRAEFRDGYMKFLDDTQDPYATVLGRTRLFFDYKNDRFLARFALQHAYVWGDNANGQDTITKNTINIYEGWFQYNFTKAFGIKLGRMEIIYDNQRLIGNSNWGPQGNTFDAGMLKWEFNDMSYRGDFSVMVNNFGPVTSPYLSSFPYKNFKYMGMLYEQKKFMKDKLIVSFLGILDVSQKASTSKIKTTYDTLFVYNGNDSIIGTTVLPKTSMTVTTYPDMLFGRLTLGGTVDYTWKKLKVYAEGYYQGGHFNDGRKINAGMFGVHVSYKVFKPLTLLLGYEMLSGNDYSDTTGLKTKYTSFSTLYGTAHSKYGYMDLFNSYVKLGTSAGLTDLYAKATVSFTEKTSLEVTWRMFGLTHGYLQSKGKPGYTEVDKKLGNEFDFMFNYKVTKNLDLNAAYCFFLTTDAMDTLEGFKPGTTRFPQYAYVMLSYKPNFFTSEK